MLDVLLGGNALVVFGLLVEVVVGQLVTKLGVDSGVIRLDMNTFFAGLYTHWTMLQVLVVQS